MPNDDAFYRKIFSEIINGFSQANYLGKPIFIKHFNFDDQYEIDLLRNKFLEDAKAVGIFTREEREESIIKEGAWSKEENDRIQTLESSLSRLKESRDKLGKDERHKFDKEISSRTKELTSLRFQKETLIGITCDKYAESSVSDYYIFNGIFLDKGCSKRLLSPEKIDFFSKEEEIEVKSIFNGVMNHFSDTNIKRVAIQDFFQSYWSASGKNAFHFFGKPTSSLTFLQVRLVSYGNMFNDIFSNLDNIPDDVRKDPDRLVDFANNVSKIKDSSAGKASGSEKVIGGNRDEMKAAGIKTDASDALAKKIEEAKKSGKKKLGMKDMMDLFK